MFMIRDTAVADCRVPQEVVAKEIRMLERDETKAEPAAVGSNVSHAGPQHADTPETVSESTESEMVAPAIPRPATVLERQPHGKMGKFTVSLLYDSVSIPSLEDIERINQKAGGDARTPLMTVIQAILAKHGGSMLLEDLATEIGKYWNRPLPTTPYSLIELVYVLVRGADSLRVR
jgi:hypothetical protein